MLPLRTPDVTLAQLGALLTFVVGQAVAWGFLSNDTGQLVVSTASTGVAAAWKIADAIIRANRARAVAAVQAASLSASPPPPVADGGVGGGD